MKKLLFALLFILFGSAIQAQTLTPVKICDLPADLAETSGLTTIGINQFLSHTDSGNEPKVMVFDSLGVIKRKIKLYNATNIDWEDLTKDKNGNIYVGDFGNNNSDRNNLRIYIIPDPKTITKDSTPAGILSFTYSDQKAFPPAAAYQNYDMEAFFWFNDSLYLFSKNRTTPYNGYTKCYQMPARTGVLTAKLIDSFYTGNGTYLNYSVTGAAINSTGNKVVLLGYDKCWIFSGFTGRNFFKGKVTTYPFNSLTQKEAVYFESDLKLMITQENSIFGNAGMFRVNLPLQTGLMNNISSQYEIEAYPNPVEETMQLLIRTKSANIVMDIMLFDTAGKKVKTWELLSNTMHELDLHEFASGTYFIKLTDGYVQKIIKE
ncbi:MAG: T9SS type A sorting domain-containing protein [Bacteroidota bacterium]|nr:T9SS type A sorting domain-containing protein [Bacteroidota bacterium]